ncbi:penicillin acylase family protein [Halopseudomonas pelagia]|uniref:penicillin acylase family protein n=1 Tax=Halopseudomonas pelagia TaxID=553151 RepID=UPI0003A0A6FA|nr:penicillin acylase family protein [Halopseudomonas pelagia]
MHNSLQYRGFTRLGLLTTAILLGGCLSGGGGGSSSNDTPPTPAPSYNATIERTTYGVPHITADNYGGAGYGHGYAIAEDNLCVLADAFVTFRGERSQYFGPDQPASPMGTFGTPPNLEADFFFRFLIDDQQIDRFKAEQTPELLELSQGFAAGYSRYVKEIRDGQHVGRHASCRNEDWLVTISEDDVLQRLIALNLAASSANWVEEISNAQPPAIGAASLRTLDQQQVAIEPTPERFLLGRKQGIGSNTFAFGGDATESGGGLLLANPHWYLLGVDRFYQLQMTIPGKLDISGAAIIGSPMVLMGFNDNVAWAHTVSTARRFTLFQLQLVEGDPTRYLVDDKVHEMSASEITVQVKQSDGSLAPAARTLYRSSYGPMIDLSGLKLPGWNNQTAFTLRDANLENTRAFQNFLAWNHAESLTDFYNLAREYVGIPWVNTAAIGRGDKRALYSDITTVPNVPDNMLAKCLVPGLGAAVLQLAPGLPLLDGSRLACNWRTDADSAQPGAFGPGNLPSLFSTDYVANMNDSYWLSNPEQPLTGFAGIIGREDYAQSLRTRMGHTLARERLTGTDGLNGHLASSENIRDISLNSRVYSAERLKTQVLAAVCDSNAPASEQQACLVLSAWDNTGNLDSRGAHIWSAFWAKVRNLDLYATPFDANDPINTPDGLSNSSDVQNSLREAFSASVVEVVASGVALDARLGEVQFFLKPGEQIPQYGGEGSEGYFTVLRNSYMHVVDFPEDEPVRAYTLVSHAQSTDPSSPHYSDYTEAYSAKQWHRVPFTREQIEAELESSITIDE